MLSYICTAQFRPVLSFSLQKGWSCVKLCPCCSTDCASQIFCLKTEQNPKPTKWNVAHSSKNEGKNSVTIFTVFIIRYFFSTSDRQSLSDVLLLSKVREIGNFQCISGRPRWEAEVGGRKWEAVLPWLAQIDLSESPSQSGEHLSLPPRPPTFGLPLSPRPPTFVMWSVWANQMCHKSLISCSFFRSLLQLVWVFSKSDMLLLSKVRDLEIIGSGLVPSWGRTPHVICLSQSDQN